MMSPRMSDYNTWSLVQSTNPFLVKLVVKHKGDTFEAQLSQKQIMDRSDVEIATDLINSIQKQIQDEEEME